MNHFQKSGILSKMEPFSKKWNHFQKGEQFFKIGTFSKKGTILKNRNCFLNQTILTKEPFWRNKKKETKTVQI